jgi:membrane protease subunit HflK
LGKLRQASSTIGMPMDPNTGKYEETPKFPRDKLNPAADGYTLTGDANIIHARATITYTVNDPIRFTFDFTNAAQFVTNALDNALIYASSRFTADELLTTNRLAFNDCVARRARELISQQQLGIDVVGQIVVFPYAPGKLIATFEGVTAAYANSSQSNNVAVNHTNETLVKARAEAHNRTNSAFVASETYVSSAKVESKNFCDLLEKFKNDPQFYYQLRQSEVVGRVLASAKEKMFLSKRPDGKRELRLQLSREPEKPLPPPPPE